MNVIQLNEYLQSRPEDVIKILKALEFPNISYNKMRNEARFASESGSNPTSNIVYLSTLRYHSFSTAERGNIYSLVMSKKHLNFPQALEYIASTIGISKSVFNKAITYPFGGYYKKILRQQVEPELEITTYPNSLLDDYKGKYSLQFFQDGINFQTQEKYQIGIDFSTMRVAIPHWTFDGKLCGIMGRSIDKNVSHEERWLPIIPHQKSYTLFGYHQNYNAIQEKGLCIVFESEKAVCQLDSFGCYVGLATGGCHISSTQAKYLKALMIPRIILAYDEGLKEDQIIEQAQKLKCGHLSELLGGKMQIGYIWDDDNTYLPKGSKNNAADMGKEIFTNLIKQKVRWLQ